MYSGKQWYAVPGSTPLSLPYAFPVLFPSESVQIIAGLRWVGNAPDARRRAEGDSGEGESSRSDNAAGGAFVAHPVGRHTFRPASAARLPRRIIFARYAHVAAS